ncbi:MAG TPA: hypothetical protein VHB20_19370 [Verrucomicrobiae bacterium]|jgi:hypothetical protein|nr:hypothetical protein [Verrucomicrobiae bacterium]
MPKDHDQIIEEKLDTVIELLQNLLAVQLANGGVPQGEIGKRVHVSTAKVGEMLQGFKKSK